MEEKNSNPKPKKKTRRYIIAAVIILIIAVLFFILSRGNNKPSSNAATATISSISQEALETGTVKPMESVDLAFEKTGTVASINGQIGDKVAAGETISSLENGSERAAVQSAEAALQSAEAKYQQLSQGDRPEEISVQQAAVDKAKQDLENYYSNVPSTINNAYNNADSAVNQQTDGMFSNDQTASPNLTFNVTDSQIKNDVISSRIQMTNILSDFNALNNTILSSIQTSAQKENFLTQSYDNLLKVQDFLIKTSAALDSSTNLSETTLTAYKTNIAAGRTNVNTATQTVSTLINNIASQKITVEQAERQLALDKLGSTPEVLAQQQSAVAQAEADVKSAKSDLAKTMIVSPINGTITRQDGKVGEIATASTILISIMSSDGFKIEAYVPEADLAKVKIGDKAEVTMDAYGNNVIFGTVVSAIDPAETVIDGVSTYKTTFTFDSIPQPLRSGMTANITIKTAEKTGVLVLPQRAIFTNDSGQFVNLITATGTVQTKVETGLKGSDGNIEIVSGLKEGDKVLNSTK